MAELSYTRKYRPKAFTDYLGDDTKRMVLPRMADEKSYPQVWLFYGERGCGKTTIARLLASEYLCRHKVDGHACGVCEICQDIQEKLINSDVDSIAWGVTELNIASDSGKAKMQEVLDDALQPPMEPLKYKLLILDECHMATVQAQNLLLKYVEEPPKHLIIMFCTTDKEKMLDTLIDRCQVKIHVVKPKLEDIKKRLIFIAQQEGLTYSDKALELIIKKSDRNPRRSITKLEEIANGNNKNVDIKSVLYYTNTKDNNIYFDYMKVAKQDIGAVSKFVVKLKTSDDSFEPIEFMSGFVRFILDALYVRYGINTDEYEPEFVSKVAKAFKEYTPSEVDTLLQIVEHSLNSISGNGGNSSFAELELLTTAIRIGKLHILSKGLHHEIELAQIENAAGEEKYDENNKLKPLTDSEIYKDGAMDALLSSVFGETALELSDE